MYARRMSQDMLGEIAERDLAGDALWKMIQKNTFTRWTNEHLKKINKSIADLETDLSDGLRFIALVEVLSGKRIQRYNKRPKIRSQKLENCTLALEFLQNEEKIRIVNIDSSAIVDCKLKLILGLIWTLILHYSISMPVWDEEDDDKKEKFEQTPKQRLLGWVTGRVPDVPVNNFTTDWNDGRAIGALVDGVAPGLCPDWESWNPKDNVPNATEAMEAAEQWLEVPQLIKPAEMCDPRVDELSMMTYLSQFPNAKLKAGAPLRPKTNANRVRAFGPGLDSQGNSVGAPARFTVETFSAGRGDLDIEVTNPDGVVEHCEKTFNKDRNLTYSCFYTPTKEGDYKVSIKFAGTEIQKSPFTTSVEGMAGDASKVTASGAGLQRSGVMAKNKTSFDVHTKNAGTGVVDVVLVDPQGHKHSVTPNVVKRSEELWQVEYTALHDGLHTVNVLFAGKPIPHSPFSVGVSPAIDGKKCYVTGRGVQSNGVRVGDAADFKVHTAGAGDGKLKVDVKGPGGVEEEVVVKKEAASVYACHYKPSKVGEYVVSATFSEQPIFKSPFNVDVAPERPTKIRAYGPGLHSGVSGHPTSFIVETNGETGGLGFSIEGPSQAKIDCSDNGDGSATITYLPTEEGEYAVHILCDDEDIHMSPWMADIKPPPPTDFHPSKVKVVDAMPKEVTVDEAVDVLLDTRGAGDGDLNFAVYDSSDYKPVESSCVSNRDGTTTCSFTPRKAVKHVAVATFGGAIVASFPHLFKVTQSVDPSKVRLAGAALSRDLKAGQQSAFTADCSKAGPGELSVVMQDEEGREVPCEVVKLPNGIFQVLFTPTRAGVHKAQVYFADQLVPESPAFKVLPTSDPSKVVVKGEGVKETGVSASLPVSFIVDASEAGEGSLDVLIKDPEGNSVRPEITQEKGQNNVHKVTYTPETEGSYVIPVKFNNLHVPNSPFNVSAQPVGNAQKVSFVDKIDSVVPVGKPCTLTLDPSEAGEGQITCRIGCLSDDDVDIDILDNGDGTVSVVYTPNTAGEYAIEIKFGGKPVPGGSFVQKALGPEDYEKALLQEQIVAKNEGALKSGRGGDDAYRPVEFSLPIGPVFSFVTAQIQTPSGVQESPKVVDNHDGSVGIVYTPHEEGLHKLSVDYNDTPIHGSPFDFFVANQHSGKVTAHGPGLSHGVKNQECNFTVVTKDAGNGGLAVSIEGPSKADMNCQDNRDGTCSISYLPTHTGLYKVNVLFEDQHIPGSPFTAKISPSDKDARTNETVGRSSEVALKLTETDLDSLTSSITYPSGKVLPCTIKRLDDGQIGIGFTPTEVGVYQVEVLKYGTPVPNSPFKITVTEDELADASKVKAYGRGLREGKANEINRFSINSKNAGYGAISLSVEGPSKAELECFDVSDGVCDVKYKPSEPGNYVLNIKFADEHIPGSPFLVKMDGGVMSEELTRQKGVANQVDVGSHCEISLTIPAIKQQDLESSVISPSGKVEKCAVESVGRDQFNIAFVPKEVGVHTVSVKHQNIHIPGSPFQFTVGPIVGGGAHKVKAVGPGLERAVVHEPAQFNVHTREAGAGCLSIAMEGPSKADIQFTDAKDESCLVTYTCDTPGDYLVYLKYNEQNIPDSPFRVSVSASHDQRTLNVSELQELGCQLNVPAAFTVGKRGGKGGLDAYIVAPSGAQSEAVVEEVKDEKCTIRFVPRENGLHKVFVRQDSVPLVGSPFTVLVGNVEADPSLVRVFGEGLVKGTTGRPAKFIVDTTQAGSGALAVTVDGPSKVQLSCKEVVDGYEFSYLPSAPGDYLISVKYGGSSHVPGSPFKATVTGSGKAGEWNEQSNIVVETVTKSSTTHKYSAPERLFDSDASKVQTKGSGLKKASANQEATFVVDTSRAGHSMLLVGVMGPELPCEEVSVKHQGDSQYSVIYRPGEKGEYVLVVKWGEQHIPGSPFHIEVQ